MVLVCEEIKVLIVLEDLCEKIPKHSDIRCKIIHEQCKPIEVPQEIPRIQEEERKPQEASEENEKERQSSINRLAGFIE